MCPRGWISALFSVAILFTCAGVFAQEAPLTRCAEIRALPREVAARGVPVRLRVQVTFTYENQDVGTVVENGGEGIYLDSQSARSMGLLPVDFQWPESLVRGSLIEVEGVTGAGHFAPVIFPKDIRVIGAAPLQEPRDVTFAELLDGRWDCQRVRLRGVVQFAEERQAINDRVRLDLVGHGGRLPINSLVPLPDIERLVDAEVEVTGVIFTYFNYRGELIGSWLQVSDAGDVRMLLPGPADPFTVPEMPLTMLRPFSREGVTFHRRRCTGTVTLARPGEYFYMQDHGRGVRVETLDPTPLAPGDRVEVAGFIKVEHFGKLHGAVFRKIGSDVRPEPQPVIRKRVLGSTKPGVETDADDMDGLYVTLVGRVEKVDAGDTEGPRLLVESENRLVEARFSRDTPPFALTRFQPGSEIRLNGVIGVRLASGWPAQDYPVPVDFDLMVHTPDDIAVLRRAPWWTSQRLWLLLGGLAAVLAFTLGWNWLLRRRVELRSAELAREMRARHEAAVEFNATLRERERLAADLHDTLEQSLTGLAFQLETTDALHTAAPDRSARHLAFARQLLSRSREEVRRSVWNLRSQSLDGRNLPEALRDIAASQAEGRAVRIVVETEGTPRPLPDIIAGNLLLLAQEALTNALKHSEAHEIATRVAFANDQISLTVHDDGRGFDAGHPAGPKEGHFGLQGMRERIKRLGGTLQIESVPGKGTRISARVPTNALQSSFVA